VGFGVPQDRETTAPVQRRTWKAHLQAHLLVAHQDLPRVKQAVAGEPSEKV
jgi:hypothetical protein